MRRILLLVVLATAAASCSNDLGTAVPGCVESREANGAHIIEYQSVPGASLIPCIRELPPGWIYNDLVPERGRTRFHLDSDRVGAEFLEVTLQPACDIGAAEQQPTDEPGTELYVEVFEAPEETVPLAVVPAADPHLIYAQGLLIEMSGAEMRGRTLVPRIDDRRDPQGDRIADALDAGIPALAIADFDVDFKTVTLHLPGRGPLDHVTLARALDEVENITEEMRYRAKWFYRFEGGCTTYDFDAEGRRSATVAADAADALGFFEVAPVLELFRTQDLPIGAPP